MPVLAREVDLYPNDLLDQAEEGADPDAGWWALYTFSRRDKELMRKLRAHDLAFYGPTLPKRFRTPRGRVFVSHVPLFPNYVFMYGNELQRYEAVTLGCVSKSLHVVEGARLTQDLRQIRRLLELGVPLTPEARLQRGRRVRVRSGSFRGCEGVILRREGKTRLLVAVEFLEQGVSMVLEDCNVEDLDLGCPAPRPR